MVHLGRELREDRVSKTFKLTQHKLWMRFLEEMVLQCVDLCDLIIIMISILPHSGWVERAYSYLDQLCQKKRNHLNIGNLKELFFFAILKLQPKDSFSYEKKLKSSVDKSRTQMLGVVVLVKNYISIN